MKLSKTNLSKAEILLSIGVGIFYAIFNLVWTYWLGSKLGFTTNKENTGDLVLLRFLFDSITQGSIFLLVLWIISKIKSHN